LAVSLIAILHGRGGFGMVLAVTAICALVFAVSTIGVAVLAGRVEAGVRGVQPAE
jgi:hypothetical protein